MARTLIIPGIDGSPAPHWQHWWASTEAEALMVEQDDWANPDPDQWEVEVAGMILQHPGATLVAHSLGCLVVARLLRRWLLVNISGVVMVAPADPAQSPRLSAFSGLPRGTLGIPAVVVASRNDPWMSFTQATALAADWGADLVDLGFSGHINVASGHGPWPEGKLIRDELLARQPRHVLFARTRAPVTVPYGVMN
jgi:predicted alpha/beta hydrolase family esterase